MCGQYTPPISQNAKWADVRAQDYRSHYAAAGGSEEIKFLISGNWQSWECLGQEHRTFNLMRFHCTMT